MTPATRRRSSAWSRRARSFGRSRRKFYTSFEATNDLFAEVSAKNEKLKLYDSMTAFRSDQYQWQQVCESTYDNYMIRKIRG